MALTPAPALLERVRGDFTRFVTDARYPCLGARAALRRGGCRIAVYGPMGTDATTTALAADLAAFGGAGESGASPFVAFVAMFLEAAPPSELAFEAALWRQLTMLGAVDETTRWADGVSDDPDDPHFAFSFAGHALFVIGMHPESSRLARRLAWPTLVFNPHAQFRRLRAEGRFEGLRRAIRTRDAALQGSVNPNLADAGERSEARQYSGRPTDDAWRCPFHRDHPADA
ncbi:MAG TPA: guanitoxin biosynthesis heme-dependent pre-guanitoxin N-hydroxylase GntA [Gemmatimonadaceae bacterium]|nr:guanitoxin biosynthesis heme-dependent pre-guanitoxin N-hydroxylase GntA [Gemmatimonadaceae bacterium]